MSVMATKFAVSADQSASRSRDEWRQIFFDEIDSNAELLERENAAGDDLRRLSPAVIDMLRNSDLRLLKYPAELGGAEADNALQFEVFERLAYYNAALSGMMSAQARSASTTQCFCCPQIVRRKRCPSSRLSRVMIRNCVRT